MAKPNSEVVDVIRQALHLEIRGRHFYNHAARSTENKLGKKMFEQLAREEVEHLKAFGEIFTQALDGTDWRRYVKDKGVKTEAPLIDQLKARMRDAGAKSDLEAIRIGLDLERDAMAHFQGAAEKADDALARELFERIAKEETLHYDLLQTQYDSVAQTGFWFDTAEFYMDGKY
jgi:rubrerythrin